MPLLAETQGTGWAVKYALREEEIENTVGYAKYVTILSSEEKHYITTDSSDSDDDMFDDDYDTEEEKVKKIEEKWRKQITKNILEEIKKSSKVFQKGKSTDTGPMMINALPQNTYAENQSTQFQQEPISQSRQQIPIRQPFPQQTENTNQEQNPISNSQDRYPTNQNDGYRNNQK